MKQNDFPLGWDEERVRRTLARYEAQTEAEAVAEDEAAFEDHSQTVLEIPEALPLTRSQREDLDRRLDELEAEGPTGLSWDEVVDQSRALHGRGGTPSS